MKKTKSKTKINKKYKKTYKNKSKKIGGTKRNRDNNEAELSRSKTLPFIRDEEIPLNYSHDGHQYVIFLKSDGSFELQFPVNISLKPEIENEYVLFAFYKNAKFTESIGKNYLKAVLQTMVKHGTLRGNTLIRVKNYESNKDTNSLIRYYNSLGMIRIPSVQSGQYDLGATVDTIIAS
jgi:hypothetical protein